MGGVSTNPHLLTLCSAGLVAAFAAGPVAAQTSFTDVTERAGLHTFPTTVRGISFADYDNDGLQDVLLVGHGWHSRYGPQRPREIGLFRNTGDGRFAGQTALLPPEVKGVIGGGGAVFGDYDNDGDEDLFVPVQPQNVLLRNDRGRLSVADPGRALRDSMATDNVVWLDYDRDGRLDLYVSNLGKAVNWPRGINRLLRNLGDGIFADRTAEAGLEVEVHPEWGGSMGGTAAGDFSDDGWPDIYLGVFKSPNRLFLSDGEGGFDEGTVSAPGDSSEAYGVAVGDIDNDGDLDLFQAAGGWGDMLWRSSLLMNLGEGEFTDVTESMGLGVLGESTQSPSFADMDNDGDLDLIVGSSKRAEFSEPFLFLNDGMGTFADHTAASGMGHYGHHAICDFDEDGFIDLLFSTVEAHVGFAALYRNDGNANRWLRVELVGVESNRSGIGARVLATSGDRRQMREVLGGVGNSQHERVAHFGLGDRAQVDRLEIRWPSGQVDVLTDVPADQKIRVFEGREGYHRAEPTVWVSRPVDAVIVGATTRIAAAVRPALFEPGARIASVTADLSELGGPADIALRADEAGVYRLSAMVQVDAPRGSHTIRVNVEQTASLGDHWAQLSHAVTVVPGADLEVFQGDGDGEWAWYGEDLTRVTDDSYGAYPNAWSPDGTHIAFTSGRDGNTEIYACSVDGSDAANLTNDPGPDYWAAWSPDGSRIAFYTYRDGKPEVYAMDADGSNPTNLTNNEAVDAWPSWSPDGTRVAFLTNRDGNFEIYAMDADGGNPVNLTQSESSDVEPSWSPDGTRIAFRSVRDSLGIGLCVLDVETGAVSQLTEGGPGTLAVSPSMWSPDGTRIVFSDVLEGNTDIYAMDVDDGELTRLTHHPGRDWSPTWSPDGERIAFASQRDDPASSAVGGFSDVFVLTMGDASRVSLHPQERGTVFEGSEAMAVRAGAEWWLSCQPAEPYDWAGYAALHFAFHPGDLGASGGVELSAWIDGMEVDLLAEGWVDPAAARWQAVEIPLARFALKGPIAAIDFSGDLTGTFYIDDVRLVAMQPSPGSTAVEESGGESLPKAPTLAQNYPNPFNSGTVMRFTLSEPGEVRLTVYNLAGQEVVTLAQGARAAGPHAIRWDGRDDDGRALASGIYLYRLGAGDEVLTRKLALIR